MRLLASTALIIAAGCSSHSSTTTAASSDPARASSTDAAVVVDAGARTEKHIRTVFVIVMENADWSEIHHNKSAPFVGHLIETAAHADRYENVPGLHPSEPNYIWLEAGASLGIKNDADPAANHRSTHEHLTALLRAAGIPWKAYMQSTTGDACPLRSHDRYAAKHDPFVYFDDVTGDRDRNDPYCVAHVRPFKELATDLADSNTTPQYAFIVGDLCHDMHDRCPPTRDRIAQGDTWLRSVVEEIQASPAYEHAAIIITWDESEGGDRPIGLIVVSPFAKARYVNTVRYTHSSTLKTIQEVLGVEPLLGDAAAPETADLSDLFQQFP